jgi:hypothetical protein
MRSVWVALLLLVTALVGADGAGAEDWTREVTRVKRWLQHGQSSAALRKSPAGLEHYLQVVEVCMCLRACVTAPRTARWGAGGFRRYLICRGLLPCAAHGGTTRVQQAAGG